MKLSSPRSKRRARLEIIPLIDIIFFLLATFMIVSLSMVKNKSIPVHLPTAGSAVPQEQKKDFETVTIDETGAIFFDKKPITLDALAAQFQQLKTANDDPKVFINGDEKSALGVTISVLDAARKAGIHKVSFNTNPAPKK